MTPGEYKAKGAGVEIDYGIHESPFGDYLIGITRRGICFLSFACDLQELKDKWPNAVIKKNQKSTAEIASQLFQPGAKKKFKVLVMGTSFQVKVWEALLAIPAGHVLSYSDIAKMIQAPKASRAVGTAIAQNAIAWLIPCHRVIRESGHFNHYRWDPIRKKAILVWENQSRR